MKAPKFVFALLAIVLLGAGVWVLFSKNATDLTPTEASVTSPKISPQPSSSLTEKATSEETQRTASRIIRGTILGYKELPLASAKISLVLKNNETLEQESDSTGSFEFRPTTAPNSLNVIASGYVSQNIPGSENEFVIQLVPQRGLRVALQSKAAIPNDRVYVTIKKINTDKEIPGEVSSAGVAEFAAIDEGYYQVSVLLSNRPVCNQTINVPSSGWTEVICQSEQLATLSGFVKSALTGLPIVAARVEVQTRQGMSYGLSGEDGSFHIEGLPVESPQINWSIDVKASGFFDLFAHQTPEGMKQRVSEFQIDASLQKVSWLHLFEREEGDDYAFKYNPYLLPAAKVAGRVFGGDGKPVPGAQVRFQPQEEYQSDPAIVSLIKPSPFSSGPLQGFGVFTQSDENGHYLFDLFIAIPGTLYGFDPNKKEFGEKVFNPGASEREIAIDLTLTPTSLLCGKVTDETGKPVLGATLLLLETDRFVAALSDFHKTDRDGLFCLSGIPRGSYRLLALKPQVGSSLPINLRVFSGEIKNDLNLVLNSQSIISGRVEDEYGVGVPNAVISAFRKVNNSTIGTQEPHAPLNTKTTADGSFELRGLVDGMSYEVSIFVPPQQAKKIGVLPASQVVLPGNQKRVVFRQFALKDLSGKVQEGAAPSGSVLWFYPQVESGYKVLSKCCPINQDGSFAIQGLLPGKYKLDIRGERGKELGLDITPVEIELRNISGNSDPQWLDLKVKK